MSCVRQSFFPLFSAPNSPFCHVWGPNQRKQHERGHSMCLRWLRLRESRARGGQTESGRSLHLVPAPGGLRPHLCHKQLRPPAHLKLPSTHHAAELTNPHIVPASSCGSSSNICRPDCTPVPLAVWRIPPCLMNFPQPQRTKEGEFCLDCNIERASSQQSMMQLLTAMPSQLKENTSTRM